MADLNRRQFVAVTAAGVCLAIIGDAAPLKAAAELSGTIDIGTPADYPSDIVSDKFLKTSKVLVIRNGDRLYAASGLCTHRGCTLRVNSGAIRCPCHGSKFSQQGTATSGPARSSLTRFGISLNDQGRLIVDRSMQFSEAHWDDPAAFVSTKPAS